MGKAGRWLRSILAGKKGGGRRRGNKEGQCDATPFAELPAAASPREKKRWSFRRPAPPGKAATPSPSSAEPSVTGAAGGLSVSVSVSERALEQSKHAVAVAAATAAAADAASAAATVICLTAAEAEDDLYACPIEEAAAATIQATFRGYLVSFDDPNKFANFAVYPALCD
jgi:hypothetical protein